MNMNIPVWMWTIFIGTVILLLLLDLGLFHKKDHEIGVRESLVLSGFYIGIALIFGAWVWYQLGEQAGEEYLTGYLIEKSLSLDNIFVISIIFNSLAIPRMYQHRVLFWGILGAIILRGLMIGLGATLVQQFTWILYIFAVFLVITGFKMLFTKGKETDITQSKFMQYIRTHLRITHEPHGHDFFIKKYDNSIGKQQLYCTPLFLALIMIECADAIFAVDSVPAIFVITTNPFIVYTSNIFAILGLRALYFALAAILPRFIYLKYALSLVLIFIGSKIFIADAMNWEKFPASISLGITVALLSAGVVFSLYKTRESKQ